jgi:hypothetical protein
MAAAAPGNGSAWATIRYGIFQFRLESQPGARHPCCARQSRGCELAACTARTRDRAPCLAATPSDFATAAPNHPTEYVPCTVGGGTSLIESRDFEMRKIVLSGLVAPVIAGLGQLDTADGPAVLFPNGHFLATASPDIFESEAHAGGHAARRRQRLVPQHELPVASERAGSLQRFHERRRHLHPRRVRAGRTPRAHMARRSSTFRRRWSSVRAKPVAFHATEKRSSPTFADRHLLKMRRQGLRARNQGEFAFHRA